MAAPATIRLALIGLSSTSTTSWASEAHLPYLLSPVGRQHYEIVALLNSSVSSAEAAKRAFGLPDTVKTNYPDSAALAADPDIDLIVCCTRVDVHYQSILPAIQAGKGVYIEWPIAENWERASSLAAGLGLGLGEGERVSRNSIAGLQGRLNPVARKVKQILAQGKEGVVGRVLSSDISAFGNLLPTDALPEGLEYFADREVGGNQMTIAYAHMIDYVHEVLGEFEEFSSRMQIQRPLLRGVERESDVPDRVVVHGRLVGKDEGVVVRGATLGVTFRSGQPFKGAPGFVWTINGEKGEIRVTSPSGPYLQSDSYVEPARIEVHVHRTGEVVRVDWDWEEWQMSLPLRARLVADVYERYARWVEDGKPGDGPGEYAWPTVQDAVLRHREIETLFEQDDAQRR